MFKDILQNKTAKEKVNLKGIEIVKIAKGIKTRSQYEIEITDTKTIEGGVEIYARVKENGKQIGFGKDGTVDIERFRFFNPPILVEDPNGDIVRESFDDKTGKTDISKFREDPNEAILQALEHTIFVKKEKFNSDKIITGKIGRTTSTFYPAAGANSPMDGRAYIEWANQTFSAIRTGAGTGGDSTSQYHSHGAGPDASATTDRFNSQSRIMTGFNTASIPDTDTISSAVLSLYGFDVHNGYGGTPVVEVQTATPTSASDMGSGDFIYTKYGTTRLATGIAHSSWASESYNDFTLNTTGIDYINKTGNTFFGTRNNWDIDNSFGGTWASGEYIRARAYTADETGTAKDPKLVVEHAAVTGPANLKSVNGLAKASIKSIGGVAIASVKSYNGLA